VSKTTHYFKLEYPIALRGRVRITPDKDGIWITTDADQAKLLSKCIGVTRIEEATATALQARRKMGTRSQPDDIPAKPKAPRAPTPPKGTAPRSAQEKAAQEKAAHLAAKAAEEKAAADIAARKAELAAATKAATPETTLTGAEVGDVLDEGEAELFGDGAPEDAAGELIDGELIDGDDDDDDDEKITAETIDAMTKAELRELLDDWGVAQLPTSADRAALRTAAKAALTAPTA
jgi:hypothetical protein